MLEPRTFKARRRASGRGGHTLKRAQLRERMRRAARGDTCSCGARRGEEHLVVPLTTGRRVRTNVVERLRSSR